VSRRDKPGRLARVDARLVPVLARLLRRTGNGARRVSGVAGPPGRWMARWSRRNPTVATALVAVAAAGVLFLATGGDFHHAVAPAPPVPAVVLPGNSLGPVAGQPVSAYLTAADQRRSDLDTSRSSSVTAIVDFNSYLNGVAAESVLSNLPDVHITQAYVRAPSVRGTVHALAISPTADLDASLSQLAAQAQQFLDLYHRYVRLEHRNPSPAVVEQVNANADRAAQARVDVAGISPDFGCVFAVEVAGPPGELRSLAARPDVRVLDPAPSNVPDADLLVVPLEPQVQGIVPTLDFADPY
jgi:hypothetical protein